MAATCDTNRDLHERLRRAFKRIDADMTAYCKQAVRTSPEALAKALELLRVHTLDLAEASRARCASAGDEMPSTLNEEIRNDWVCWCYRQFRTWSREEKPQLQPS
jgi:hypothetical protein